MVIHYLVIQTKYLEIAKQLKELKKVVWCPTNARHEFLKIKKKHLLLRKKLPLSLPEWEYPADLQCVPGCWSDKVGCFYLLTEPEPEGKAGLSPVWGSAGWSRDWCWGIESHCCCCRSEWGQPCGDLVVQKPGNTRECDIWFITSRESNIEALKKLTGPFQEHCILHSDAVWSFRLQIWDDVIYSFVILSTFFIHVTSFTYVCPKIKQHILFLFIFSSKAHFRCF